ncbi:hypothetical protein C8Q80DRAFT_326900 [Daedaleopsis nitida]|nr:hypothetical protein C8Q80DRAFT_326900 [Daedaleopsis nitida]
MPKSKRPSRGSPAATSTPYPATPVPASTSYLAVPSDPHRPDISDVLNEPLTQDEMYGLQEATPQHIENPPAASFGNGSTRPRSVTFPEVLPSGKNASRAVPNPSVSTSTSTVRWNPSKRHYPRHDRWTINNVVNYASEAAMGEILNPWIELVSRYFLPIVIANHLYRRWRFRYHSTVSINGSIPDRIIYLEPREGEEDNEAKPVDPRDLDDTKDYPSYAF